MLLYGEAEAEKIKDKHQIDQETRRWSNHGWDEYLRLRC